MTVGKSAKASHMCQETDGDLGGLDHPIWIVAFAHELCKSHMILTKDAFCCMTFIDEKHLKEWTTVLEIKELCVDVFDLLAFHRHGVSVQHSVTAGTIWWEMAQAGITWSGDAESLRHCLSK